MRLNEEDKVKLKSLKNDLNREVALLGEITKKEKERKNQDIILMLKYYQGITEKEEDRRTNLYNFALQILAICFASIGIFISVSDKMSLYIFWALIYISGIQILFSFIIVLVHEQQSTFKFPFLYPELQEFGNKWKWFYYGNKFVQKISTASVLKSQKLSETAEPYLVGLKEYIYNYAKETIDIEITDNIQHAYLLMVHNYFKNKFFLQLVKIRLWSIYVTFFPIAVINLIRIIYKTIRKT